MKLIRVRYGKKRVPKEQREYQINGVGPVGCLEEYKAFFRDKEIELYERCCDSIGKVGSTCPKCGKEIK